MNAVIRFPRMLSICLLAASMALQLPANAEDAVPPDSQSDERLSVWVDNATLSVFVSQLALLTGRQATVDESVEGRISGRFDGSMSETLGTVTEQYPVLFDMDDTTLGVVPETDRSSATVSLGDSRLNEQLQTELLAGLLPGNSIDIRDSDIVIHGHPSFVKRMVKTVTSAVAKLAPADPLLSSDDDVSAQGDIGNDIQSAVVDVAASVMVEDLVAKEPDTGISEASSSGESQASRDIEWVTDIPGFDTF